LWHHSGDDRESGISPPSLSQAAAIAVMRPSASEAMALPWAASEKARLRLSPAAEPFVTDNDNRILNCGNHSRLRRHCNCPLCLPKC
jgi:hypothetical protein